MINWGEVETPPDEAQEAAIAASLEAREYLASTHWYVTRLVELGEAIPEDVKQARAEAYAAVIPD